MRKTIILQATENNPYADLEFLDLESLAQVEITSECEEHPIEAALIEGMESGWQAVLPGEQTIRIIFDQPQAIQHIFLMFDEHEQSRTQEFILLYRADNDDSFHEILRQQYHFSPPTTTREIEHYNVNLNQMKTLELRIMPDISGGAACAKLKQLRLA